MLRKLLLFVLYSLFLGVIFGAVVAVWGYNYITRDLPQLKRVEDYTPPAVSRVFARDGTLVGEFYRERRYPARLSEIPEIVRNAFLAAEDASFYKHPGIDPVSILRAFVKNTLEGRSKQGGSTITQQVVKNLLLSSEKSIERKVKEAILSYQLENRLTKDGILEIYLNQIFFGNTAYGIKAAARLYFHKELNELTLGEAAILAGLPKAPTDYSPILNPKKSKRRQKDVLRLMTRAGFISPEQEEEAVNEAVKVYPATSQNIFAAPFYVSEARRVLTEKWKNLNIDTDGLEIYTALDLKAEAQATANLRKGLREVDKRRGWRGPLSTIKGADRDQFIHAYGSISAETEMSAETAYPALVTKSIPSRGAIQVDLGGLSGEVNLRSAGWAKKRLDQQERVQFASPESGVRIGDVIEVAVAKDEKSGELVFSLDQTPDIEGALTLVDPYTGEILAVVGGYSYQRSQFNRATQSYRQPGSTFKPVVYLSAVDGFQYTPATIVYDLPRTFRVGDQFWTPSNFDSKFLGGITLRVALEKSRNLVSADIVSRIGVDAVIQYARKLGIESPLGRNLSLALGSSEVTLLELTRAYGVFAARGVLMESVFVTKIVDRLGRVLYDYEAEKLSSAKQVLSEGSAYVMSNMMRGVVEHGTGYRVKELERPAAGKTGTSNDEMDTWFIGFTPQWACGVWIGFDQKKRIGDKETGGRVAAPVFLYFMRDFLNYRDQEDYRKLEQETKAEAQRLGIEYIPPEKLEPADFQVPSDVEGYWVDKATGVETEPNAAGAIYEYFVKGTKPNSDYHKEPDAASYLESPDL